MKLPDFMIIGANKAGTTSLHYCLDQHKDVCMSDPKEPFFFPIEFEKGLEFYQKKYFGHCHSSNTVGESMSLNLFLPYVPKRIHKTLPDCKFLVVLRNPVDRAYSQYWHWRARGAETLSFEEAIQSNLRRLENGPFFEVEEEIKLFTNSVCLDPVCHGWTPYRYYIDAGYYALQLSRYIDLFGEDRVKVVFFDDFISSPLSSVNQVFEFLGLGPLSKLNDVPSNKAISEKVYRIYRALKPLPVFKRVPKSFEDKIRTMLGRFVEAEKPPLKTETRRFLVDHYRPYNEELARLTGRNLDKWNH